MKRIVLIVAGGRGTRMKKEIPKQFIELNGLPILMHTINRFYSFDTQLEIRLCLPKNEIPAWESLCVKHEFTINHQIFEGGETRFHTVKSGIQNLPEKSIVAIHDGVRPLVSHETIAKCFHEAEAKKAVIPVYQVEESLRKIDKDGSCPVDRQQFRIVQTPQVFWSKIIIEAYQQEFLEEFTDDASVVEKLGYQINLVDGNKENIKITTLPDLDYARSFL